MKEELSGQIMKNFVRLLTENCSYLKENDNDLKNAKYEKRYFVKKPYISRL